MVDWMKSILVFTIFFSVILFMMPDEKYKKYVQTAIGFVMIIVVINPIVDMLGFSDELSFDIRYEVMKEEFSDTDDAYYSDIVAAIIKEDIYDTYGADMQVHVYLDESQKISHVELSGSLLETEQEKDIRDNLSKKYGINEDMIIIY